MRPSSGPHCDRGRSATIFRLSRVEATRPCRRHDDHDPSSNRCFGGMQGTYSHASTETGCPMRFGVFLPPQAQSRSVPRTLLAFRTDLHRREFHRQGGRAARCRRAWHRPRRAGYKPARAQHSRRGRELRFRPRRWFLCRCHRGAVVTGLPDVLVYRQGVARGRRCELSGRSVSQPESSAIRWAVMAR